VEGRFLQTSPEFAMKRLLAEDSGPIYYLGKAFRKGEVGRQHNPEFTIVEWYRPGWDHFQLIEEVDQLFQTLLGSGPAKKTTYTALFQEYFNIHPHLATAESLQAIASQKGWIGNTTLLDKDNLLDLLMTHGIEPYIGQTEPLVVIDYPASQASLSKIRTIDDPSEHQVAERFEFYYRGLELANGYHELLCADEQQQRFENDLRKRASLGLDQLPIDHELLGAMRKGLPPCAGVAVGMDRLLMIKQNQSKIAKVIPFAW
jgi:lysyl-tRNA synthetase class 2